MQALSCPHNGCTFSAFTHHGIQTNMSTAHKAPHQSPQTPLYKHYRQVSEAKLLRLARQRKRLKTSAFKDSTSERYTNHYHDLGTVELDGKILRRQTYATTSGDTDAATQKAFSQLSFQICDLCNENNRNDTMSTPQENCVRLDAIIIAYRTVSTIRKLTQKETEESTFNLGFEKSICFSSQVCNMNFIK